MKWWVLLLLGYSMFVYFMQIQRSFFSNCSEYVKNYLKLIRLFVKKYIWCLIQWSFFLVSFSSEDGYSWMLGMFTGFLCYFCPTSPFCIILLKSSGYAWQFDYVSHVHLKYYLASLLLEYFMLLALAIAFKMSGFPY